MRLKSSATRLFVPQLVQADNKGISKSQKLEFCESIVFPSNKAFPCHDVMMTLMWRHCNAYPCLLAQPLCKALPAPPSPAASTPSCGDQRNQWSADRWRRWGSLWHQISRHLGNRFQPSPRNLVRARSTPYYSQTWESNYIHCRVWGEISHPFPNFKGATVEVWESTSNFIPHFATELC